MSTVKISALPAASDVTSDDLVPIVNDPSGTPVTQKATATQVKTFVNASIDTPGDFKVATTKFTVASASGNTVVGGTLGVTGDVAVNTNKFNVTASSGNTTVAGTLGVTGDVAVNTNKFNVTASSGNTAVAGTLSATGDLAINTNKFNVTASSGNTTVAGTFGVTGDVAVNTNKFNVTASSGNTTVAGTLGVSGVLTASTTSVIQQVLEKATVSATAATGTINFDALTQAVLYYTSNASANWTLNVRGSSGTSLDTMMSTGQSLSIAFLVTQGSTAYYASAHQIDGNSVTPVWQGGTAPTAGNASGIDAYVYTIIKTGSATFKMLASQTQFK